MQNIKIVRKIDKQKWSDFVYNHPNGNVFQIPEMYSVYQSTKNYEPVLVAAIDDNKNILGILLAVIQKEYSGLLGNFTARSIIFGGPLTKNNNAIILDSILKEYSIIIKRKAIYSQFRNFTAQNLEIQNNFAQFGYNYEDHFNIIVDLSIGIDLLWKGVKRNRKDGVNKGKRQGFTFEVTKNSQYIDSFYKLLGLTYQRAKLPYPSKSFFNNLIELLKNNFQWFILKKENEPIIILLSFTFKKTIYAYYIGIAGDNEILKLRPVDYFYWKVIEWGVENNFNYFDWMGAGKPKKDYGVRKFKLQYGGELLEMGRYERIHKPFFMEIGKIGLKLWQKLK